MHTVGSTRNPRWGAALLASSVIAATTLFGIVPASAAIVPTVELGAAEPYSVLGGTTITNTGATTLQDSLGLSPGTSITGFPPGIVGGTTDAANAAAGAAQSSLTAAYVDAAGRALDATTTADLANLTLIGGVYAGPSKSALSLSGPLTLDGEGNAASVFIFQTDSTLTTASGSSVTLINGAQACNVFWQVGSSATLGTGSSFVGNILALTAITVTTGVTVEGRALARNAAVTLDTDVFQTPACATTPQQVTTTTSTTSTTQATTTTTPATTTTTAATAAPTTTAAPVTTTSTITSGGAQVTTTTIAGGSSTDLPRTGSTTEDLVLLGLLTLALGLFAVRYERSRRAALAADRPLA